jgi:hypothetical protein
MKKEIKNFLKERNLKYEEKEYLENIQFIKKAQLKTTDKIPLTPLTYGDIKYNIQQILYIPNLTIEKFHYIKNIKKPIGIITNKKFPQFYSETPVFFTPKKLKPDKKAIITFKEKTKQTKIKILISNVGFGANFINVYVPQSKENLEIAKKIIKNLQTITYPRGYRTRFIFINTDSLYLISKLHSKLFNTAKFNVLIDKTGFGYENLVYKINGIKLINKSYLDTLYSKIENPQSISIIELEDLQIPNLIWYKSIVKELSHFNPEKSIRNIFAMINLLGKKEL